MKLTLTLLVLTYFLSPHAEAGCMPGTEGACGDQNICVSDQPTAKSGRGDNNKCLPAKVCGALRMIAKEFGKVEIASAMRVNNARRGGAKNSWHKTCNAADFLVPNHQSKATQQKLAKLMMGINGIGKNVYCTGRSHVSISPREYFYSSCVAGGKKRAKRKHR
ncbi:MAG: D-Ala-D-Ala carboxypeptidase family metallohydrolase [Bacteriovoracia bacterium]